MLIKKIYFFVAFFFATSILMAQYHLSGKITDADTKNPIKNATLNFTDLKKSTNTDENGNYSITGRNKDMIIRGGENISPREIEEFLYHMPGVKDAQVVAVASPRYGEDVGVFIIPHDAAEITAQDVPGFCKDKNARYIFFLTEYPLTGSGKIQKFKLREMALEFCEKQGIDIV